MPGLGALARVLLFGEWRAHRLRTVLAMLAIAVGVAMGYAIHLINAAALNEFSAALKSLSGQADIVVGGREALFDEAIYPLLARHDGVALASPVLMLEASVPGARGALAIVGIDPLRAGAVTPDLLGVADDDDLAAMLADDAVFLSPAALAWLELRAGGRLALQSAMRTVTLRVAGAVRNARAGQRIGVMDIGAAQWRFERLGQLSRIDLKLADGVDRAAFRAALAAELERAYPGRFLVGQPGDDEQEARNARISRAYRVNLTVLALVALFTGSFLVFSTQALAVIRRRGQFALLRVLGMERAALLRQVLLEGAMLGVVGALLGIGAGYALAALALRVFGADLGAGYFSGGAPELHFAPLAAAVFFVLGLGVALLGCAAPALEAARAAPAVALKSGADEAALARLARLWPALACIGAAALLVYAPPVFELPLAGYAAIALLLVGAIALMPRLAAALFGFLNRMATAPAAHRQVRTLTPTRGPARTPTPGPVLALTLARPGRRRSPWAACSRAFR